MVCRFKKDHKNFERFSWLQMFDNILARLRCFPTIGPNENCLLFAIEYLSLSVEMSDDCVSKFASLVRARD